MGLFFENWLCRSSSGGHILTAREGITESQLKELQALLQRKMDSTDNPKLKLTENMEKKLSELIAKRDAPDSLPSGAITHLEDVFRSQFWKRRRLLFNKFLDKGNYAEQEGLALKSFVDNDFYEKNDEHFSNEYAQGTPDHVGEDLVIDIKCNYDMDSFDKAELTKIYEWQLKFYLWLTGKTKGQLVYTLVNTPYHQLIAAKKTLWYQLNMPDQEEDRWIEAVQQLERNMIFDIEGFKEQWPAYDFENVVLDFDVHPVFRVKQFDVTLEKEDIEFIKSRVVMCREWLCNKEKEVLAIYEKLKQTA